MGNVQVVSIELVERNDYHIIDVRSPAEFQDFHIKGARNVPIFSNEERADVGTTYKQVGKEEAKMLGLSIVSPKLVHMVNALKEIQKTDDKPFLIYCARGGMRSNSFATVMSMMGIQCFQLEGGIRSYRQKIVAGLEAFKQNEKPFVVLEGLTGSRKTDLLEVLEEEGYPVLNLEQMAGHRGSIFGEVGTDGQTQKAFDRNLFERLNQIGNPDYFLIESESKRIGKAVVPDWILKGKESGKRLHIHYPIEKRVRSICETYQPELHHEHLNEALVRLKKRMDPKLYNEISSFFHEQNYENVVRLLLEHYYDPKYTYTANQYNSHSINVHMDDLQSGLQKIKSILRKFEQYENVDHL